MSNQGINLAAGLGIGALLFLGVNSIAPYMLRTAGADLTEQKLFTLSDGTRSLVGRLEEPIKLRLYFSRSLVRDNPVLMGYAQRVENMLRNYVDVAGGKIDLEIVDPLPFSEDEERAVEFGIQGVPANNAGDLFYFGLVGTNLGKGEKLIPALDPSQEAQLEYQLTEIVESLANPKRPAIGLVSGHQISGGSQPGQFGQPQQTPPWAILDVLNRRFDVRTLDGKTMTEIPEEITTLLLIHPKGLTTEALYAIDQWCLRGGKVVAFVDPFSEFDSARRGSSPAAAFEAQVASEFDGMLKAWGIDMQAGVGVGDRALAIQTYDRNRVPVSFPPFIELGPEQMSDADILTQSLKLVRMIIPGALSVREDKPEGAVIETLLETTETGGTIDTMRFLPEPDPVAINESFASGSKKIALAMRVSGTVRSAFPEGAPKKAEGAENGAPEEPEKPDEPKADHLAESSAPFNAIVIADSDMLYDPAWSQQVRLLGGTSIIPNADNAALLVGALENLTGSSELISLRARADYRRPFTLKQELAEAAQQRFRAEEARLEEELRQTEQELNELQNQKDPSQALFLSPEQEQKLEEFRQKELETRRNLRRVKLQLRSEIDSLGSLLTFANTLLIPLVLLLVVGLAFIARRK